MEKKVRYIHTEEAHNLNASSVVVPILIELFQPKNILDVGCGIGTWLYSFYQSGIKEIFGLDGDYVNREALAQYINDDQFQSLDLNYPFDLGKKFDLVISLEVAEHLPESSAEGFVGSLVKHGDIIVFSAAIPNQGGQNHLNEQWKKYWIDLFGKYGFDVYDLIRPKIWNIAEVEYWYKQNMIIFSKCNLSHLKTSDDVPLETIHPEMFAAKLEWLSKYINELHEQISNLKNELNNRSII